MRKLVAIAAVLVAVASAASFAGSGKREEVGNRARGELQKIDARLKLNSEQRGKIRTLLDERSGKLDALYAEIEPREDAIRTEYNGKIRDVLTPEQQTEWDKIKGEYRQKWNGSEASGNSQGKPGKHGKSGASGTTEKSGK